MHKKNVREHIIAKQNLSKVVFSLLGSMAARETGNILKLYRNYRTTTNYIKLNGSFWKFRDSGSPYRDIYLASELFSYLTLYLTKITNLKIGANYANNASTYPKTRNAKSYRVSVQFCLNPEPG